MDIIIVINVYSIKFLRNLYAKKLVVNHIYPLMMIVGFKLIIRCWEKKRKVAKDVIRYIHPIYCLNQIVCINIVSNVL